MKAPQALTLFAMVMHFAAAWATIAPQRYASLFSFNNGRDDDPGKVCSEADWALVQGAIASAKSFTSMPQQRLLRSSVATQTQERKLGLCDFCGKYCVKVGLGCVPRPGRRQLSDESNGDASVEDHHSHSGNDQHRKLAGNECDADIANVTVSLRNLMPKLASSCQALIAAPTRNITCVPTTEHCFVKYFNFWDARFNLKLWETVPTSGASFCKSRFVSFEAETNYFIGKMQWIVNGTRSDTGTAYFGNRTEFSAPYFLNGNSGRNVLGVYFPPGNFTLTATSEDDPLQSKTIAFRVRNC